MPIYFMYGNPEFLDAAQKNMEIDLNRINKIKDFGGLKKQIDRITGMVGLSFIWEFQFNRREDKLEIVLTLPLGFNEFVSDKFMRNYKEVWKTKITKLKDDKEVEL